MSTTIKTVLPDTGPLITLAHADALDALLVFDPDRVQLVLTDMVEFEATRRRSTHEDAQRIADFIIKHAGRIAIEPTAKPPRMSGRAVSVALRCRVHTRA